MTSTTANTWLPIVSVFDTATDLVAAREYLFENVPAELVRDALSSPYVDATLNPAERDVLLDVYTRNAEIERDKWDGV